MRRSHDPPSLSNHSASNLAWLFWLFVPGRNSVGPIPASMSCAGRAIRGDQGHLRPRGRAVPQSEVIRAILLEGGPCCEGATEEMASSV